jgi:hypothetical protein
MLTDQPPAISADDGLRALEIALAAAKAAGSGRPERISPAGDS